MHNWLDSGGAVLLVADGEEEREVMASNEMILKLDQAQMDEISREFTEVIERHRAEIERLRAALLSLRIDKHEECEDCWYSCPKSGHCCNEYQDDDICTCGTDRINKIIDDALKGGE